MMRSGKKVNSLVHTVVLLNLLFMFSNTILRFFAMLTLNASKSDQVPKSVASCQGQGSQWEKGRKEERKEPQAPGRYQCQVYDTPIGSGKL